MAPEFGLFASAADSAPQNVDALLQLAASSSNDIGLVQADDPGLPSEAPVRSRSPIVQMTAGSLISGGPDIGFELLGAADGAEMLALATLTVPGPFFAKTHLLGDFIGVKLEGQLVAMAGERMKLDGFTEVSGVCTHPAFRGRGYGSSLARIVSRRILERNELPFLHVYGGHRGTISLYEALGFTVRMPLTYTVISGRN